MGRKIFKVLAIILVVGGVAFALGFKAHKGELHKIEKIAKFIKGFYGACNNDEATVIIAELGIVDLGKKGHADAAAELEKILPNLKKQGLKNFTRFLIADSYKKKGEYAKSVEVLRQIALDNVVEPTPKKAETK
jgi:hypothetical protein